jgi:hypothetical protein
MRLRRSTLRRALFAAPVLAAPVIGAGLAEAAAGQLSAGSGSGDAISMNVKQRRIAYGHDVTVTGHTPSGERGRWVDLDFSRAGSSTWQKVASGKIGAHGRFHLQARLRHSGTVKVTGAWQNSAPSGSPGSGSGGGPLSPASDSSTAAASRPQSVQVMAALHVAARTIDDMGAHKITVPGELQPVRRGLEVRLQARGGGGWHVVARGKTGRSGRFWLHYRPTSRQRLRVHFVGDRSNAPVYASAGKVLVFTQSVASWYYDSGNTACGFHATYGVANVSLPCGTKVTFDYHGRSVTATVDDRGPYVSGREWDLNQTTASRLGFAGVDSVWASR